MLASEFCCMSLVIWKWFPFKEDKRYKKPIRSSISTYWILQCQRTFGKWSSMWNLWWSHFSIPINCQWALTCQTVYHHSLCWGSEVINQEKADQKLEKWIMNNATWQYIKSYFLSVQQSFGKEQCHPHIILQPPYSHDFGPVFLCLCVFKIKSTLKFLNQSTYLVWLRSIFSKGCFFPSIVDIFLAMSFQVFKKKFHTDVLLFDQVCPKIAERKKFKFHKPQ